MIQVVETFFDLTVGFPLAVIGLIGLIAFLVAGGIGAVTLVSRKQIFSGLAIGAIVLVLLAMILGVVPGGGAVGIPLALIGSFLAFSTHARLSRDDSTRIVIDSPLSIICVAALIAMTLPILLLIIGRIGG